MNHFSPASKDATAIINLLVSARMSVFHIFLLLLVVDAFVIRLVMTLLILDDICPRNFVIFCFPTNRSEGHGAFLRVGRIPIIVIAQTVLMTMNRLTKIELAITSSVTTEFTLTIDVKTVQGLALTGRTSTKSIESTG